MAKVRVERINSELTKGISEILGQKLKNAAVTGMVSVVRVQSTPDLKHAKVWISIFQQENIDQAFQAIVHSAGFVRRELASMLRNLRTVPELHFILDDSAQYSEKINRIINEINQGKDDD